MLRRMRRLQRRMRKTVQLRISLLLLLTRLHLTINLWDHSNTKTRNAVRLLDHLGLRRCWLHRPVTTSRISRQLLLEL